MPLLNRSDFWRLEVHWYPHAVEAGVQAVPGNGYTGPGHYRPYDFDFDNPPSRQDFLDVCNTLPWTHGWKANLLDLIGKDKCDWPMIDFAHKGSSVYIHDDQGRQIGELKVWRHALFVNEPYATTLVTVDAKNKAIRGYRGQDRIDLGRYLDDQENRIREDVAKTAKNEKRPVGEDDLDIAVRMAVLRWRQQRKKQPA